MKTIRRNRHRISASTGTAAVAVLLGSSAAFGHANEWIDETEGGLDSEDAIESASNEPGKPNLCEGINGIPFGGDPGWVRTNGSPNPNTPFVEARGQVLPDINYKTNPFVTHTDAPFNHYSHDINTFVTLDVPYRHLLASGNFIHFPDDGDPIGVENEHSMIELEWERSGVPFFAYPAQSDRIAVWGPHVFDCGHGEEHVELLPNPDDPMNPIVIVHPTAFRTEIHSPVGWVSFRNTAAKSDRDQTPPAGKANQDPWIWYESTDHQGVATTLPSTPLGNTPVQATVADAFFSTYGGNIPEALNGCDDTTAISDDTVDAECLSDFGEDFEWAQPLLNQDYTFFVPAPPKPSAGSIMVWESADRCGEVPDSPGNPPGDNVEDVSEADDGAENIGAPTCNIPDEVVPWTENGQPGIRVTVKAESSDATYPSNHYVAFARTYKVAWDEAQTARPRVFDVAFGNLRVFDDTEIQGNDGEWVISLVANQRWQHPVRGSGDGGDPFWENGALDDGCDDDDACTYATNVSFGDIGIVPGETLNIKMHGWDDDTTFIQDNDVNEVLPVVNVFHPLSELPGSFVKSGVDMDAITSDGAYTLGYTVAETTPTPPTAGTLTIGDPKYGPNADTGGEATRISAATPLTFSGSDGTALQYKFWLDGTTKPAAWQTDSTAPFNVSLASAPQDGRYRIEFRPVSAGGVVGTPGFAFVELDTTPPTLHLPDDFSVYANQTAGALVEYAFSATDNLPGPVTAACDPAPGSVFPNGANGPLTTTVHCTAEDAVENVATDSFDVTVISPVGYVNDYVLLGVETLDIHSDASVSSGNVGVFDESAGLPLNPGLELRVALDGTLPTDGIVAGDTIQLGARVVAGDVVYADALIADPSAMYTPHGPCDPAAPASLERCGYVPLWAALPAFLTGSPGSGSVKLGGTNNPLAPGSYGAVELKSNAVATLTGGDYSFASLHVKPGATLRFSGPSTLRIAGRLIVQLGTVAPTGAMTASDLVVYVAGTDEMPTKPAVDVWAPSVVSANVYAANGTVMVGNGSTFTGAAIGRRVDIGSGVTVTRDSAFLLN
jgi:hypothetical protein